MSPLSRKLLNLAEAHPTPNPKPLTLNPAIVQALDGSSTLSVFGAQGLGFRVEGIALMQTPD